jgi:transcription elongation factor GreA
MGSDPDSQPLACREGFGYVPICSARPRGVGRSTFPLAVMIEELKQKLGDEVERLTHELNVVLPNEIRKAVELGDLRENSEYKAALERQQFVQARLSQLRQRLSKLSQIDLSQIPLDKVGLGSRVVVQSDDTAAKETYYLVFTDAENFDEGHVTMASPIGRALIGKAVGDNVLLKLPAKTRRMRILELRTIHEGGA